MLKSRDPGGDGMGLTLMRIHYTFRIVIFRTMRNEELKSLRGRLGLTQAALAKAVGVVPNTLARWERGEIGIPGWAVERLDAASRSGPSGTAVTRPRGVVLDPHHRAVLDALNGTLDPAVFEACAVDLLKRDWSRLVLVPGGGDDGFDGAVADGGGREPFPLVVTTATDLTRNLRRNLSRARRKRATLDRALFATSRRVTPSMRQKLEAAACKLDVTLLQIYDQDWFAQRLYGERSWCQRLLHVTGRPRSLSPFPVTRRPVLGDRILGRESETRWLQDRTGDCLLVGAPGAGKTFLLRALVLQGRALFKVDDDREQLANDLRSLKPSAVIIDDAHLDSGQIERFAQLRTEVGSDARIIATSWPGDAAVVRDALQIPDSGVLHLDLIDADTMIEIIKSAGIAGPDELLYHIRLQADGRPGLAATLSHLCLAGDVRRAVTGEGLVDQLVPQINRMLDVQDATRLLAPFALGGDAGVRMERVADQLRRPLDDVSGRLAQLAAAGVVMQRPNGAVSVEPAPMRWVLVRRFFFGGAGSPDITSFLHIVENAHCAIETLIGARARGAPVPDLEAYLEQDGSDALWASYAAVGPSEARHAIRNRPDRVGAVAEAALHHAPESVIALLLDRLRDTGPAKRGDSENALELLDRWVTGRSARDRDSIRRRSILLDTAMDWWEGRRDARAALRVVCIALQPEFSLLAPSPGDPRRGRFVRDHLADEDLKTLTTFWPRVKDIVRDSTDVPWDSLFQLVRSWRYLHQSSLADIAIAASTRAITRPFAERMLRDLIVLSRDKPGVQTALREIGRQFRVTVETTTDRDFEDLYPPGSRSLEVQEPDERVIDRWCHRGAERIALSLARVQTEASHAGLKYPPWAALYLCERLALTVPDPVAVTRAFMKRGLPAELVRPFLHKVSEDDMADWASIVHCCLKNDRYRALGFEAAICHPAPPSEIISAALGNAGDMAEVIETCFYQGLVPSTTTRAMLRCPDSQVAGPTAIGLWQAVTREGRDGTLDEAWRRAILLAPVGEPGGSAHGDYWIGEIMSADYRLAEEWLLLKFGEHGDLHFWRVEDIVTKIVPTLDPERRTRVLMGLRPDPWNEGLVRLLIGDDDEIYRKLLGLEELALLHLAPLRGKPDGDRWRAKALRALERGLSCDDIVEATLGTSHGWTGSESEMWAGWRRSFEALLDDVDRRIARIGERGAEIVKEDELRALAGERYRAVHGLTRRAERNRTMKDPGW